MRTIILLILISFGYLVNVNGQKLPNLIPYVEGDKWGYSDSNGKVKIKAQWEYVDFFKNGRAIVRTDESRCLIDTKGNYIIPPYRDWDGEFYTSLVGAHYNAKGLSGKYGIIDSNNNEMLPCLYDKPEYGNGFTESGYFKWSKGLNQYIGKVKKDGKLGLIDTLNHTLIPFKYDGLEVTETSPFSSPKYYVVHKQWKMGLIDVHGREIIPTVYRNLWLNERNDNQFMLFKERTTVIADSTGKIVLEIPGYRLEFPVDSLVQVQDSTGKAGLMNFNRKQLLIPCEYIFVGIGKDTLVVSKQIMDSADKLSQQYKYIDRQSLKDISGWLTYEQYRKMPPKEQAPALNKKLPHYYKLRIQGKELDEYFKEGILWSAAEYRSFSYIPFVRGIASGDTVVRYSAIIDSNGNIVIGPLLTNNKITVINATDSLLLIDSASSFYAVTDFHLKPILHFQPNKIACAFFYQDSFYAIATHIHSSYKRQSKSYSLIRSDSKAAKGFEDFTLLGFTDANGLQDTHYQDDYRFNGLFKGYFMVLDSLGKSGIVDISGKVQIPGLSFKYDNLTAIGPEVFIVNNKANDMNRIFLNREDEEQRAWPYHGFPYIVNRNNKVLLDSLSVDQAILVNNASNGRMYHVYLQRPPASQWKKDISFYMDNKGRGYYGKLEGDKIENRKNDKHKESNESE